MKKDRKTLENDCKQATVAPYYCSKDAQAVGEKFVRKAGSGYHRLEISVEKEPKYGRRRPAAGKPRSVLRYEYLLTTTIIEASFLTT